MQLGILRLGLLEDGNIRIGIFPQRQKILVRGTALRTFALHRVGAPELQMRQRSDGFVEHNATMVEEFLKFFCRFNASVRRKKRFSSHIDRIQIGPVIKAKRRQTKFMRSSDLQSIKRPLRVRAVQCQLCAKSRKEIELYDCVFVEARTKIVL